MRAGTHRDLQFCLFAFKRTTLAAELQVSIGPRLHLLFWECKTAWSALELLVPMGPNHHLCLLHANSVISTRITSLHGSQTSPVVLCMQNNVINIRITSLYGSQPSSVIFACKTVPFSSELQVSMCPRLRLLICEWKTACLDPEWR